MQHVVTESLRHHREIVLVFVELRAVGHAAQAVGDAQRELPVAPDLEQRLVLARRDVVAARIDDAGQAQAIELAEKELRALDLLLERRLGQAVEQLDQVAGDRSGRLARRVAFERVALRQVGVGR